MFHQDVYKRQTTTIGIRYVEMVRTILPRRTEKRQTSYGEVAVKICEGEGEVRITPEYESIREICRERGLSFQKVYELSLIHIFPPAPLHRKRMKGACTVS